MQYAFFTVFISFPIAAAWILLLFEEPRKRTTIDSRRIRILITVLTVILVYCGSVFCFLQLHTDAQAAIAFVFLPFFVSMIPGASFLVLTLVENLARNK